MAPPLFSPVAPPVAQGPSPPDVVGASAAFNPHVNLGYCDALIDARTMVNTFLDTCISLQFSKSDIRDKWRGISTSAHDDCATAVREEKPLYDHLPTSYKHSDPTPSPIKSACLFY